ncbi:hypothetical protein CD58_00940 [Pseudomonas brassicacearum]|uniref:DUF6124 family protein n=1 Tax=Pseudomonas brassicacearum TaxID=930166 RepID=UPI00042F107A|nr:DUF6124 family protein [Pseudomonas brassicacearum]AHL31551.1 hypothetical protein CD58_00940 [Pseudomonas brassicacearum]
MIVPTLATESAGPSYWAPTSISAIAADLADDVDGSRRSVILAISRMADGVHLLVERAMDRLEVQAAG